MALQPLLGPGHVFNFVIIFFTHTVGLLGQVISPSQGRYLYTRKHKHRINVYTDIHALSGIRTHDPSFRVREDRAPTMIGTVISYHKIKYICIHLIHPRLDTGVFHLHFWAKMMR
jgi:hypothetical protein